MGVYCTLKSATREQLEALEREPDLVSAFYDPEHADVLLPRPSLFARVFGRETTLPEALRDQSVCMEVSVDKAWDGLNYLFTRVGQSEVAGYLLEGGTELSRDAHMLSPDEVRAFRDFVHGTPEVELRSRFDPEDMERLKVYPSIIWTREREEALDWLFEFHQQLWAFLRDAVEEQHGCVIWVA